MTCLLCCREAIARMRARAAANPGEPGGRIVNVGSRAGLVPGAGLSAYVMAKAAVHALTVQLAEELRDEQILVNAVLPSIIDTPANRASMPGADPTRWVSTESLSQVIAFLLSDGARDISGAAIPVYGRA